MNTSDRSELGCLQEAASSGHRADDELPRLDRRQRNPDMEAVRRSPSTTAPMEVKKHQHKHNLKHRYEVMETLGKGTYGKVKKAVERASLKTVSWTDDALKNMMQNKLSTVLCFTDAVCSLSKHLSCRIKCCQIVAYITMNLFLKMYDLLTSSADP